MLFARVGIRRAFAVILGGHSRGIRGHSRAFARLVPLFPLDGLHTQIKISPKFVYTSALWDAPRGHAEKTRNSCRADPLYNTINENRHSCWW